MNFEITETSRSIETGQLASEFENRFQRSPTMIASAPGRVNLIGEHTDYNLGMVLPMAMERKVDIVLAPREDRKVRIYSKNFDQETSFSLDAPFSPSTAHPWSDFVQGVAHVLSKLGHNLNGFDGLIWGNVPLASGLSSSAALEVAAVLAFHGSSGISFPNHLDVARIAQSAERDFVGVNCGLMDQFICAAAIEGHALKIRCDTMEFEAIPLPTEAVVIVGDTKLSRSLAASAYNQRRQECDQALQWFQDRLGSKHPIKTMRDLSIDVVSDSQAFLPDHLFRRVRHISSENQRVEQAAAALATNDLKTAGELFNASHESLRYDYEVSSDGLDGMVDAMNSLPGCYGARLTGAGFGGCAIALVDQKNTEEFLAQLPPAYLKATGNKGEAFPTRPSEGGRLNDIS